MPHLQEGQPSKRRKVCSEGQSFGVVDDPSSITSYIQLRDLLTFHQGAPSFEVKRGINQFKAFIISINEAEKESEKSKKLQILRAYCDSQRKSTKEGPEVICFPDLVQTWSFADSNNNESILVAVPSVLAIFLKAISTQLQFRDFGLSLCKFLLQKEQLKLFNRNLTTVKAKEHLISPCIRLLTEIVSFDGGTVAHLVYSKRDITFKRIDVFLTPNKAQTEDHSDDFKKSTLRRNAMRYILANLRFQNTSAKSDLIEQHKAVRAFFEYIKRDPRDGVVDIIKSLDKDIARDNALPRRSKIKFFNRWNLERLVTLYGYDKDYNETCSENISVSDAVHKLLVHVCTVPEAGVLLPETGWYPAGSEPETLLTQEDDSIDLGLDSAVYRDTYWEAVPVRNGTLSSLVQALRPESDTHQIELLLAIFKAAPELVADFFTKRTMFASDPKPIAPWLGESAFLFSTVQLAVPAHCGWKDRIPSMPPPISIAIENILPRPLTRKILTRCLNQNSDVVILFAIRILTAAFRKLRSVLEVFNSNRSVSQTLWNQASSKLVAQFCHRCPSMKDVVLLFKRIPKENLLQQDAITDLIALFYEVIPSIALEQSFDVSLVLIDVLKCLEESNLEQEDSDMLLSQLQNILKIAELSASMRWWQQPAPLQYSAFTSILKILVEVRSKAPMKQIRGLLHDALVRNHVLRASDASFDSVLSSFRTSDAASLSAQLTFFDNSVRRVVKRPVYYQDHANALLSTNDETLSPLVAAVDEQWPFVVKDNDATKEGLIASWISRLLESLEQAGEGRKALRAVRRSVASMTELEETKSCLREVSKRAIEVNNPGEEAAHSKPVTVEIEDPPVISVNLSEVFGDLAVRDLDPSSLYRWEKHDLDMAVEQGHIGELMLSLCSESEELRRQASAAISRLMIKLKCSGYVEWRSIYILAGELLETANQLESHSPLPWIVGWCAVSCLTVLADPMHKMYKKVNLFLQKHPAWDTDKIPSYWINRILLHEPNHDGGCIEEINWLLDLLVAGLRTLSDLDIYRRAGVFERTLSLYNSPSLVPNAKTKILHLMFQATQVGGSTTLITRAAAISWIQSQIAASDHDCATLQVLAAVIYNSCDQQRVNRWSGASASCLIRQTAR